MRRHLATTLLEDPTLSSEAICDSNWPHNLAYGTRHIRAVLVG